MIWNPAQDGRPLSSVTADELADELWSVCGAALSGVGAVLPEVVAAVDAMLAEGNAPAGATGGTALAGLAARALHAIGEERAARRLQLLGAGVIRPLPSVLADGGTLWVVDVGPLIRNNRLLMELELIAWLDAVIDCLADVWDGSGGKGTLGLRCGAGPARRRGRGAAGQPLALELRRDCLARLRAIGLQRGWVALPEVLDLNWR